MKRTLAPDQFDLDGMLKRLHLPTIRRLYRVLETRAEADEMSYTDYLTLLIAEEIAHRAQTRIQRAVRKAKFPFLGTIEDFDFTFQTTVRRQLLGSFLGPELVSEGHNLILSGPTGRGKTRLAISIAYRAIQNGFEARFATAASLIEELSNAARTGRLTHALHAYTHPHVLVIDEVGYLSLTDNAANVLFQVVNERYLERKPIIFTTNKPLAAWGIVLHDPDLAEAILDRVLERGRHIELRGSSYRTRHLSQKEVSPDPFTDPGAIISGTNPADFPEPTRLPRSRISVERARRSADISSDIARIRERVSDLRSVTDCDTRWSCPSMISSRCSIVAPIGKPTFVFPEAAANPATAADPSRIWDSGLYAGKSDIHPRSLSR
jgi:DNA replication protein DnaC